MVGGWLVWNKSLRFVPLVLFLFFFLFSFIFFSFFFKSLICHPDIPTRISLSPQRGITALTRPAHRLEPFSRLKPFGLKPFGLKSKAHLDAELGAG